MKNIIKDYQSRDVDFSIIHGETKEVYQKFINALNIKDGYKLLDLGGGYGSLLIHLQENEPQKSFQYDLADTSEGFINKAKNTIPDFLKTKKSSIIANFNLVDAIEMNLPDKYYDIVVCKMFIHEIPKETQSIIFNKLFSIIKLGGHVFFWSPDLNSENYSFYTKTIQKKDELANFNNLARERHFLLNSELISQLKIAGFSDIERLFNFDYNLNTSLRLKSEFHNNIDILKEWNTYILEIANLLDLELKNKMVVGKQEDNLHIRFQRAIYKVVK